MVGISTAHGNQAQLGHAVHQLASDTTAGCNRNNLGIAANGVATERGRLVEPVVASTTKGAAQVGLINRGGFVKNNHCHDDDLPSKWLRKAKAWRGFGNAQELVIFSNAVSTRKRAGFNLARTKPNGDVANGAIFGFARTV